MVVSTLELEEDDSCPVVRPWADGFPYEPLNIPLGSDTLVSGRWFSSRCYDPFYNPSNPSLLSDYSCIKCP